MRSAVYEGTVFHRRVDPPHRFAYRLALPLLDLDEIDEVCARHPLWSRERPGAVTFRRADFLPDRPGPLGDAVRDLVAERTGSRPVGPISLLGHLRTWGWLFNPVSFYYCFDRSGTYVDALVLEVTNTPWHERHCYVVGPPGRHLFEKALHVSPFLEMDHLYRLSYTAPGDRLGVHLGNVRGDRRLFDARLSLVRKELDRRALGRVLWRNPAMTARISAGIYRQAWKLHRGGAGFVPHPGRRGRPALCPVTGAQEVTSRSTAATALMASAPVHPSAPMPVAAAAEPTAAPPTSTGTEVEVRTASTTARTSGS